MKQLNHSPDVEPPVILVVDADSESAQLLAGYFARLGFRTSHTARGEDALRLARSRRLRVAIIDVSLLDMSGHTLASRLKEIDPEIRVLMTTRDYRPELEIRARQVGILYYAHKPTDYRELEAVVAKSVGNGGVPARHSGDW